MISELYFYFILLNLLLLIIVDVEQNLAPDLFIHTLHVLHEHITSFRVFSFVSFLLNVPINNFSVMSGRSHRVLGITSNFES